MIDLNGIDHTDDDMPAYDGDIAAAMKGRTIVDVEVRFSGVVFCFDDGREVAITSDPYAPKCVSVYTSAPERRLRQVF